jgi:hypothetical protein
VAPYGETDQTPDPQQQPTDSTLTSLGGGGGTGSGLPSILANAFGHMAGYATQDKQLSALADRNVERDQQYRAMGPAADLKAQINSAIANREYEKAFSLYSANARLGLIDPEFSKIGTTLAGQMATMRQRKNDVAMIDGMPGYTQEEKTVIKNLLQNGESLAGAQKSINENRQGWTLGEPDAEGNIYRTNKYTGEQQLQRTAAIKMVPGEEIGRVVEGEFRPSASSMSLVPLTEAEKKGAALMPGFDQAQFNKDLRSGDLLVRQKANAQRPGLFALGQASDAHPMTDGETGKVAIDLGMGARPYLSDYKPEEMQAIIAKQQALKTQLIVKEAFARAGADDTIQQNKGIKEAYGGRFLHEEVFDTKTGNLVQADERAGDVLKRLGTDRAMLDKETGKQVRFATRGQLMIDQLADLMPKILAANNGNPGANMLQAINIAIQKKAIPSETLGQWQSLQAMAKYDVAAVESRSARLLAVQLKEVGEKQIPSDMDTIQSGAGKLRVAKNGLENVNRAAFGQPNRVINETQLGTGGGMGAVVSPSGRTMPVLR